MELHGKNLIGLGNSDGGDYTFKAYNPSVGMEMDPVFTGASTAEVDRSLALAAGAFDEYRQKSPDERADFLERVAAEIEALGDDLIQRGMTETGLPEARLIGERGRTVGQIRMFSALVKEGSWVDARIDHALPDREPLPKPDVRLMLMPMGPVVVFGASNFPLAFSVAGGDTASALAAGCPVVVKAHRSHPGTAEMVGRAIQKAVSDSGMPEGVFSLLHGRGQEVGTALVKHPLTRAVGFTGSQKGGRELFNVASSRPSPIPVYAEMGSLNPVFVLPGALAERGEQFAEGLCQSVNLGVGQFCTNPGLVLGLQGEDLDRVKGKLEGLFTDTPNATMLNPGIREAYDAGVAAVQSSTGVTLVAKASTTADREKTQAVAHVFSTDVEAFMASEQLAHEVFGPCTLVVDCTSKEDMEEVARGLEGHLTATIHGTEDDLAEYSNLVSILESKAGRLIFNGFPTGVEVCASMHHGGPYPASTDGRTTSVGTAAIYRFTRLMCYQGFPQNALPPELQDDNPRDLWRLVDGAFTKE
jgi:alpha-ketoglutaric semialdehyde dehydrogenase